VVFDPSTIKIKAGETKTVWINFTPPNSKNPNFPIYSGYIAISNDIDDIVTRVPYAGVVGDWNSAPVWTRLSPSYNNQIGIGSTGLYTSSISLVSNSVLNTTIDNFFLLYCELSFSSAFYIYFT
jgi:hypothetical protein